MAGTALQMEWVQKLQGIKTTNGSFVCMTLTRIYYKNTKVILKCLIDIDSTVNSMNVTIPRLEEKDL